MTFIYICLILGIASVAGFVYLRIIKGGIYALSVKTLAGIFYILLTVLIASYQNWPILGICILVGQIFGLLGDVFLDQKYIHPDYAMSYTHLGFTVFGIGHFIYAIGFFRSYNSSIIHLFIALIGGLTITLFVYLTEKPFGLAYRELKPYVLGYSMIIGLTTTLSVIWTITAYETTSLVVSASMVAFLISDLILSQIYFGKDKNVGKNIILNYIFYYAAQFGLSMAILFYVV